MIKNGKNCKKNLSYRLQFIDSARFTANSLSNLINNLAEVIHKIKCTLLEKCPNTELILVRILPEKEDFYNYLNIEDITDADYAHAKRVCKDFEIKHLGEYHDLYVQSIALFVADVFEICTLISMD